MKFHAIMNAEMRPDVYDGENCDQIKPKWYASCEGDKGDGCDPDPIELAPEHFPPGTKITVEVPCCPDCGEPAYSGPDHDYNSAKCVCGFDWAAWTRDEFC